MAAQTSSLKDYLKKYESNAIDEKKNKKKKKKARTAAAASGVLVVDEDPVWQKPVAVEEEEDNDSPDEKPQVDEDIEFKRIKRLEQLRARRSYNDISADGSGWVPVSDVPKGLNSADPSSDISPPRNRKAARYDTPSPEPDLSPPRQGHQRNDSPSPGPGRASEDLSPPRQQHRRRYDCPSPERRSKVLDADQDRDMSPPRRQRRIQGSISPPKIPSASDFDDLSPPHRGRPSSPKLNNSLVSEDLSPRRKTLKGIDRSGHRESSAQQRSTQIDLSPHRKRKEQQKTGLITGKDVSNEIAKTKKDELTRFNQMDPSSSGRGAEPVYRFKGERVSKDEYLKLTKKKEEKPKEEKKLEWGKGLAQKREAEAKLLEMELEKEKPFARSRDDPELDRMMKDRVRWGDPMAHLVKKKQSDLLLSDLGENERMKESGFIIPQDMPSHSWIKRGLDYEPNRYGIKPGRHWDGVNRSNGYEKQMFKRKNEKQATEREAYLWSVSDM